MWLINNRGVRHFAGEDEEIDATKASRVTVTFKTTGRKKTVTVPAGGWTVVED